MTATDTYTSVRCIANIIRPVSYAERKAVHRGPRGAQCKWHEMKDTAIGAANHADEIGAKSWDIVPMIEKGTDEPYVIIKFYNRADFGMCTFGDLPYITGHMRGKRDYWFDDIPAPDCLDLVNGVKSLRPEYD